MMYFVVVVMTIVGSFASLSLKQSTNLKRKVNRYFVIGTSLYILSAVLNVLVLKYLPYGTVLPLTSLTYVWTVGFAYIFLKEKITFKKIVGLFLICSGVILLIM